MDNSKSRSGSSELRPVNSQSSNASNSRSLYINLSVNNSAPSFGSTKPLLGNTGLGAEEPQRRSLEIVNLARTSLEPSTPSPPGTNISNFQNRMPQVQPLSPEMHPENAEDANVRIQNQPASQVDLLAPEISLVNAGDCNIISLDQALSHIEPPERGPENVDPADDNALNQAIRQADQLVPERFPQDIENAINPNHTIPVIDRRSTSKEWKSWKIKFPWLSILLATTLSLIVTIAVLNNISNVHNGFAPLRKAPGFLSRDPEVERAIWSQGILYTSFPALMMTLYRTMWETTVASFADRQPYVDLNKSGGRPAKTTIMLDYKTEPAMYAWKLAFRNKHYILGFCMLSSVLLALLVVPLVAFLFTTASFVSDTDLPVSILTTFDPMFGKNVPDLRLSLSSAAAIKIQDARSPPWVNEEYAFSQFTPSSKVQEGNASVESVGYSAHLDCEYVSELDYNRTILPPGTPGVPARVTTIQIVANDRGCEIAGAISIFTTPEFPGVPTEDVPITYGKAWPTVTCSADSGWSRLSMLTARYIYSSSSIANFSLISCIPSYQKTPGTLVVDLSPLSEPSLKKFTPDRSNVTKYRPDALWRFYEMELPSFNCFDKLRTEVGDEFIRYVYKIAAKRYPASPLNPDAIIDAALTLFSTTFVVLASAELFKPVGSPLNGTGILSIVESRLVVVSPIAFIIISVLGIVALLNLSLFFYVSQSSILLEEPVGLLSAAGILHNSCVNRIVGNLVEGPEYDGKVSVAVKLQNQVLIDRFCFDEEQKKINCYTGPGTPRRIWWMWSRDWIRDTIESSMLVVRVKRWRKFVMGWLKGRR